MKPGKTMKTENTDEKVQERRDFLKKSAYIAYTTPFIMSMLVDKANAAQSWNNGKGTIPDNNGYPHPGVPPGHR